MSNPIVSFDEQAVKDELRELVRKTIEETINAMYPAGVSTRRIEDVSEILWGAGVSAGTVSNLNDRAFKAVDEWRCRPLARECVEGFTESKECWRDFLSWLKSRGLRGVRMFTGDKAAGMVGSIAEVFPGAKYQRCTVHFCRNALAKVPKSKRSQVAAMLKAVHAMESREASAAKAESVAAELESMKLKEAAKVVREGFAETLACCEMPREHWRRIRTNNAIERLNREIRRRTRVVGMFPDGKSALMLAAARLKYVADSEWGSRRYLDVSLLKEQSC